MYRVVQYCTVLVQYRIQGTTYYYCAVLNLCIVLLPRTSFLIRNRLVGALVKTRATSNERRRSWGRYMYICIVPPGK